ncbi:hypothetical protein P8452_52836 [Trifolium repens]|nr:hypothetical protein P8452_52836 [Trifolium repens]
MIPRPSNSNSIYYLSQSIFTKNSSFFSSSSSSSSSSSLITLHDSDSKPISSPFYNLLPPTQNPNNIVNLICSTLKHKSFNLSHFQTEIKHILPHIGMVEKGLETFWKNIEACFVPNVVACNCLVNETENTDKVNGFLEKMEEEVSFVCRIVFQGYAKEGKLLSALNMVEELHRFEINIPENLYDYLLVVLCKEGRPFAARSFLIRISQDGFMPQISTYIKLVESLCRFNNVEEALVLKSEMTKKNMKLNLTTYKAILSCLCRVKRTSEAESLLEEMVSLGILPDLEIKRALINGYCEENDVGKAVSLLKFIAKEFQVYDTKSYNAIVKVFCEIGNVDELMELQDKLVKIGFVQNGLTCKYVIEGLQKDMELDDDISDRNLLEA